MNTLDNVLVTVMLLNFTILTGCFALHCLDEVRERRAKKSGAEKLKHGN